MMAIITAITTTTKVADEVLEILVYHSGKKRYTHSINKRMGNPNTQAMGKPLSNLLENVLCKSLCFSQYFKNLVSSSVNILQN